MILNKSQVIDMFEKEVEAWDKMLAGISPAEAEKPLISNGHSIKDVLAHLRAWQSRTIARLEAVLSGGEPKFPAWPVLPDAEESDESVNRANAWVFEHNHDRPYEDVRAEWRNGFTRFLELLRMMPESEVAPGKKLAWLTEFDPLAGAPGTFEQHHSEHRVELEGLLGKATD